MVPVKFVEAKFTRTANRAVVKARKRAFCAWDTGK